FTMTVVPVKLFAPMSVTYGFALLGALLIAVTLSPVLCSILLRGPLKEEDTPFVAWLKRLYLTTLAKALRHRGLTVMFAAGLLAVALAALPLIGGGFMPAVEGGKLWVRATRAGDILCEEAGRITTEVGGLVMAHSSG